MKAKSKIQDDDDAQGGAASGTGLPAIVENAPSPKLVIDVARALVAIARNGGCVATVCLPDSVTSATVIKMREAGLVDVLSNMGVERARVKLTGFGVQRLVDAQKIVAAAPGFVR